MKWLIYIVPLLALVGCTSDEKILGNREELIISAVAMPDRDSFPVVIDKSAVNSSYEQPFLNSHHSYEPIDFNYSFREFWTTHLDYNSNNRIKAIASPLIVGDKVFCIDAGGILYAIDKKTGKRLWRKSTTLKGKDGQIGCAMAFSNGKVVVSTSFAECIAFDANDGKQTWRVRLPASSKGDGITIANDRVFVMCDNSTLQVLNLSNGGTIWSHSGISTDVSYAGSSGVAVCDGVVYLAYPSGELFALLEDTGAVVWESMMSRFSLINASHAFSHPRACPVVKDNVVYFVSVSGQIMALNTSNGNVLWRANVGSLQTPSVSGNSVFVLNLNSELFCLNKDTGQVKWSIQIEKGEKTSDWYGQLLIKDHVMLLSRNGDLIFVSVKDGKVTKRKSISSEGFSISQSIADRMMIVQDNDGKVIAYK